MHALVVSLQRNLGAAVPLLIGALLGGVLTAHVAIRVLVPQFDQYVYEDACCQITRTLAELQHLRAGRTDTAIELIEWELDCGLIDTAVYADEKELDPACRRKLLHVLKMAFDYRTKYPRTFMVPGAKEMVDKAFSILRQAER
jgi:hypothetical protein